MKAFRLRRSNVAEAGANKANDLQSRVERVVQREQRELRRRQLSKLRRSRSMVGPQRDDLVRNQIPPRVGQDRFRHRVTSKGLSVSGSARRRLPVQANMISASGGPPSGFRQHVTPPPAGGAAAGEPRGASQRQQSAHGQSPPPQQHQQQQRGGAPASADHGQGQGQPEGGKKKPPKETISVRNTTTSATCDLSASRFCATGSSRRFRTSPTSRTR